MKINVTLKDPDGVYNSIEEAAKDAVNKMEGLSEEEGQALIEIRTESIKNKLKRWIKYEEYIRIEFDTDLMTAKILEN